MTKTLRHPELVSGSEYTEVVKTAENSFLKKFEITLSTYPAIKNDL